MSLTKPVTMQVEEPAIKDSALSKPSAEINPAGESRQVSESGENPDAGNGKTAIRRSRSFRPIILIISLFMLLFIPSLHAQFYGSVEQSLAYTDNAFQLSEYDLQQNEAGHPDLDFVDSADDVILRTKLNLSYDARWHWWLIQPSLHLGGNRYVLNAEKQRIDVSAGVRISRKIGDFGIAYGYTPEVYVRNYDDTGGTGLSEKFSYARNQYKADLNLKPFKPSTVSLAYSLDQLYYNEFFTEFDGDISTWTLGWKQSLPVFYLDASYGYKVYETSDAATGNPEDASFESNIYDVGILIKKMPLDSRYQQVTWRPELALQFEERFYQGGDDLHRGRTDSINTTTATLHFYFGEDWNLNLDYSHIFRNVDAMDSSVRKYKEFNENRFGITARYLF